MNCNYLLLCFYVILNRCITGTLAREAIIGGEKAEHGHFLYQVTVALPYDQECGGGIIHNQFILTAAHCTINKTTHRFHVQMYIIAGTINVQEIVPPETILDYAHKVITVYIPTEYNRGNHRSPGDIAVLKLENPMPLSRERRMLPLMLPTEQNRNEDYVHKTATIAGIGWHYVHVNNMENGHLYDAHLRYAKADIIGQDQRHYLPSFPGRQICARIEQHDPAHPRGVCTGDSGGPLVYNGTTIGVLSYSPLGCSELHYGAVYTSVPHYLNFIHDALNGREHNLRAHNLTQESL